MTFSKNLIQIIVTILLFLFMVSIVVAAFMSAGPVVGGAVAAMVVLMGWMVGKQALQGKGKRGKRSGRAR